MGVKKLPSLIQEIAGKKAIKLYKFSKLEGFIVAIDGSLLLYQTVIAMRSNGKDLTNRKGELTSHLHGIFYKMLNFIQNKMIPIIVFDGKALDIKNKTLAKRKDIKEQAEKALEKLDDSEDENYIKNFQKTFRLTKQHVDEAKILLDLMGIPYIDAPAEADVICSWLNARKDKKDRYYVKGVCSDDSDMLPLGAPYMFKDALKFISQGKPIKVISLKKTLVGMNLTHEQFIDVCCLLGTDYCDNIPGIGPKGAYKLINEHKTLRRVLAALEKNFALDSDDDSSDDESNENKTRYQDFLEKKACMLAAQEYFLNALKEIDDSGFEPTPDQLQLRQFQYEELMDFMCVKHNFDVERIQNGINQLKTYYKNMGITRPNTKKVHKILVPRSENYIFDQLTEDIDFLPTDSDNSSSSGDEKDQILTKTAKTITKKKKKSKKTKSQSNYIAC